MAMFISESSNDSESRCGWRPLAENSSPSLMVHSASVAPAASACWTISAARLVYVSLGFCMLLRASCGGGLGGRRRLGACPTTESRRAPHRHAIDPDGRDAHAHRHALPLLAANADAFVQLQIVAHHADVLQRFRSV